MLTSYSKLSREEQRKDISELISESRYSLEEPEEDGPGEGTAVFSPVIEEEGEPVFSIADEGTVYSVRKDDKDDDIWAVHCSIPSSPPDDITDWLGDLDATFGETLLKLIEEKQMTNSEVYNKANISKQLFYRITTQPDHPPKKNIALACAIALELDAEETGELLEKAGYALSRSDMTDMIVRAFINAKHYDIFDINEFLWKYDRGLLGSSMN